MPFKHFTYQPFSKEEILNLTSIRNGEQKIGEFIAHNWENAKNIKFVILGIEEEIGPQTNLGNPGAKNAFQAFVTRFLSMQANRFIKPNFQFIGKVTQTSSFSNQEDGKKQIEQLDQIISDILKPYIEQKLIPIVIGGGHNNAYPILKSFYENKKQGIDVLNIDPHADFRALEGRHSGNPFSYAHQDGFLNHYHVFGLHKAYNSENMLKNLEHAKVNFTFFDDYLLDPHQFQSDYESFFHKQKNAFGIEVDLDAIAGMPSSAYTPSGFSVTDIRRFLLHAKHQPFLHYYHFPEGAPTNELEQKIVGKSLAYFIFDIIHQIE